MHSEFIDSVASALAIFIIIVVPIAGIALFWLVHILPEKIAERRHHPQKDAIKALCLLSLVFGGLLWPLAWLWAYTKPVFHQMAYGRDKHADFYDSEGGEPHGVDHDPVRDRLPAIREEVDGVH